MHSNRPPLSLQLSVQTFSEHYWYASELKQFAKSLGIAGASTLRKDELEKHILARLDNTADTKPQPLPRPRKKHSRSDTDDLHPDSQVRHYVSNRVTKDFILNEVHRRCPDLPKKSGVWYWINRWREEQASEQRDFTYGELIDEFVRLSTQEGRLPQIPSARFNNFISDFIAAGEGSREEACSAWEELKRENAPKSYSAWTALRVKP